MNYNLDVDVACECGVNEAIIINNFQFWILKNRAGGSNFHEGRTWTFNTVKSLAVVFPFWSTSQIRTVINSLIKREILMVGNFNKVAYDRTVWYAFADEQKWVEPLIKTNCQKSQMDLSKSSNGIVKIDKTIPDTKTQIVNTDKKERKKIALSVPDFINRESWVEFEQHRKDMKKPLTELARKKSFNLLKALSIDQQRKVIDYSITGRYQGLFVDRVLQEKGGENHGTYQKSNQHRTRNQIIADKITDDFVASGGSDLFEDVPVIRDSVVEPVPYGNVIEHG